MVREGIIREVIFPQQNFAAASSGTAVFSHEVIKGEILQVRSSLNQNGSLLLVASGLSTNEIWRRNASSGTNPIVSYPGHLLQDTTGSSAGFGGTVAPFVIHDRLKLTTGSLVSGTSANLDVTVLYR